MISFKKHMLMIVSFLAFTFGYSQNKTAKIVYKKERILTKKHESTNSEKLKMINDFEKQQNRMLKNITFNLLCNKYESIFQANKSLKNEGDNRIQRLAINLGGSGGIMYTNIKEQKQLWEKEAFGQLFLVEKEINDTKWTLINETKKIGNFTCFKAIAKKRIKNNKGIFYDEVIAWYCPEIPFSFGPMEFCNLPGLILELTVSKMKFYTVEIDLNFKNINLIKRPKEGKKVTYEELENIGSKLTSERNKRKN